MTWSSLMEVISEKTDVLKILPEAAEELCSALFRNSPAGIYITRNGKFIYTNIEFRRITGYNQDELFGRDYQKLINPRYRQKPKQNSVLFLFGESEEEGHEFKITTRDGKKKWISEKITYFKYGGNWLTLGHWLDITEHHYVQKAWREAERRFQSAFEDLSTGLAIISLDGIFLKVNRAFYDMVGYSEKEILESRFDEVIHPDEKVNGDDLMQIFLSLVRPEQAIQKRLISRDGRTVWTAMNISLIGDSEDAPSYFIVHFQDITEQKRIELGLKEEEFLYRSLVDRSLEPLAVLDLDCHVTHVSRKLLELLGQTDAHDILGKKIGTMLSLSELEHAPEQQILELLKEGRGTCLEGRLLRRDGSTVSVEANFGWVPNEKGAPACIVLSFKDKSAATAAQPELSEDLARQLFAFQNLDAAAVLTNSDTTITTVNPAFEKLSGYAKDEIEGKKSWIEFVAKEDLPRLKRYHIMRRLDHEAAPDTYEFRFQRRDGNVKNVLIHISKISGSAETIAILFDLSSLRKEEKSPAAQWDSLASFMDALPSAICLKNTGGNIIRINRRFADLIGVPANDIEGKKLAEVLPESGHKFELGDSEVIATGKPRMDIQMELRTDTGSRLLRLDKTPLSDAHGEISGILVEAVDITREHDAETKLREQLARMEKTLDGSLQAIASIVDIRDPYTAGHQQRVAALACAIAHEMELDEDRIRGILVAARIHDIGKIYVPMEILGKPGILNEAERHFVQMHPAGGYDILKSIDFPWPVAEAVRQHHERLDGTGYPQGLKGDEIILEARIIMVADVVEAMSSHRFYRPALDLESALLEITSNSGNLYDPNVVSACVRLFRDKSFSFQKG